MPAQVQNRSLSQFCVASASLSAHPFIRYFFLIKALTCIPAVVLPICFLKIKGTKWLLNPNLRIMFLTHLFWAIELPLTFLFVYTYEFIRISQNHENPCDYMVSVKFSLNTRILPVLGLMGQMFTMFTICCDRLFSTLFPVKYDSLKKATLGVVVSIVASVAAVAYSYVMLFIGVNWESNSIIYMLRTRENISRYQLMLISEVALGFLIIAMFGVIFFYNEQKKKAFSTEKSGKLANRYQVNENRWVIGQLLPICVIHATFFTINGAALSSYSTIYPVWKPISFTLWDECWGQMQLYPIVMSILLFKRLRKRGESVVEKVQKQDDHFDKLKTLFERK